MLGLCMTNMLARPLIEKHQGGMLVGAGLGTSKLKLTDSKDVETSEVALCKC